MPRRAFNKILIANRGEIAVRIIRACRELGMGAVAVYSEVDRAALHVQMADEAYRIGPASAAESYLNAAKILDVAQRCGAQAIHPGYGFLSENADFARACSDAGLKFIGPPEAAMKIMGSKTAARQAMERAGVPFVPGSSHALMLDEALAVSKKIGYPVMLKAAAGGGGKGMRLVRTAAEMESSFASAASEALRAFGNGEVYVEKYLERPRHIEVQVLADEHGHCIHLGERECSVQRRHQKVIEESPSPIVDAVMRRRMGETAVQVAQAAGYANAGTVEFLVDEKKNFYFLEMNTRLQVEHPVTELVTGLDLVHLQIAIAAGKPLPIKQEEVQLRGHAMECRIYAEDPDNNFFPSPGWITRLAAPSGPGIREDSGIYEGWRVPLDYDPLLSKLIAHAPTREAAIARLRRAVDEYFIGGIKTNLALFRRLLRDEEFNAGGIDTGYLDRILTVPITTSTGPASPDVIKLAAIAAALFAQANSVVARRNDKGSEAAVGNGWKRIARQEALRE